MAMISIDVPDSYLERLKASAALLGISPEELARRRVEKFLAAPEDEFENAMEYVLVKNAELYRRLAQ